MAVLNKEKYLKDIASLVRKGAVYFDEADRPEIDMGGRKVFVSGVSYDQDSGEMAFVVSNSSGVELPSAKGPRALSSLDQRTLVAVRDRVREYAGYKRGRGLDLVNIEAARRIASGRKAAGVSI